MNLRRYAVAALLIATPVFAQRPARPVRSAGTTGVATATARNPKPQLYYAQYLTVLPHLVDGGQYTSQIVVTNLGSTAEPYEVDFFSDSGAEMAFSIVGIGPISYLSGTLQPGQSRIFKTDGNSGGGPQVDGWGATFGGSNTGADISIYQILNNQVPNQFVAEATTESTYGIAGTATAAGATINFDNTHGYSCGFAFTNPDVSNSTTGGSDVLDADVYDTNANLIGRHQIIVPAGEKLLSVIQYDWPETNNNAGTILLYPDNNQFTPITPLAFRFLILPTGVQTFTTLPVLILNQ